MNSLASLFRLNIVLISLALAVITLITVTLPVYGQVSESESAESLPGLEVAIEPLPTNTFASGDTIEGSLVVENPNSFSIPDAVYYVGIEAPVEGVGHSVIEYVSSKPISLSPNESKTISFSYKLPRHVAGDQVVLSVLAALPSGQVRSYAEQNIIVDGENSLLPAESASLVVRHPGNRVSEYDIFDIPSVYQSRGDRPAIEGSIHNPYDESIEVVPEIRLYDVHPAGDPHTTTRDSITVSSGDSYSYLYELPTSQLNGGDLYESGVYAGELRFVDAKTGEVRSPAVNFRYIVRGDFVTLHLLGSNKEDISTSGSGIVTAVYEGPPADIGRPGSVIIVDDNNNPVYPDDHGDVSSVAATLVLFDESKNVVHEETFESLDLSGQGLMELDVPVTELATANSVQLKIYKDGSVIGEKSVDLSSSTGEGLNGSYWLFIFWTAVVLAGLLFALTLLALLRRGLKKTMAGLGILVVFAVSYSFVFADHGSAYRMFFELEYPLGVNLIPIEVVDVAPSKTVHLSGDQTTAIRVFIERPPISGGAGQRVEVEGKGMYVPSESRYVNEEFDRYSTYGGLWKYRAPRGSIYGLPPNIGRYDVTIDIKNIAIPRPTVSFRHDPYNARPTFCGRNGFEVDGEDSRRLFQTEAKSGSDTFERSWADGSREGTHSGNLTREWSFDEEEDRCVITNVSGSGSYDVFKKSYGGTGVRESDCSDVGQDLEEGKLDISCSWERISRGEVIDSGTTNDTAPMYNGVYIGEGHSDIDEENDRIETETRRRFSGEHSGSSCVWGNCVWSSHSGFSDIQLSDELTLEDARDELEGDLASDRSRVASERADRKADRLDQGYSEDEAEYLSYGDGGGGYAYYYLPEYLRNRSSANANGSDFIIRARRLAENVEETLKVEIITWDGTYSEYCYEYDGEEYCDPWGYPDYQTQERSYTMVGDEEGYDYVTDSLEPDSNVMEMYIGDAYFEEFSDETMPWLDEPVGHHVGWLTIAGDDMCEPGDTMQRSCGEKDGDGCDLEGSQTIVCTADGVWPKNGDGSFAWGECEGLEKVNPDCPIDDDDDDNGDGDGDGDDGVPDDECTPGKTQDETEKCTIDGCDGDQTRVRECSSGGDWGDWQGWGPCKKEDPSCPVPPIGGGCTVTFKDSDGNEIEDGRAPVNSQVTWVASPDSKFVEWSDNEDESKIDGETENNIIIRYSTVGTIDADAVLDDGSRCEGEIQIFVDPRYEEF